MTFAVRQAVPETVSGSSAYEVPLDLGNGLLGQVLVDFRNNSAFHVGMKSMPQIGKRTGRSHNDECLHIAGANDLFHGGCGPLSKVMLLKFMVVGHLHAAALTSALDGASGVIGALLVSRWTFLGKDELCFQTKGLLITVIAQKQRLLAIANEHPRVVGNCELANGNLRTIFQFSKTLEMGKARIMFNYRQLENP